MMRTHSRCQHTDNLPNTQFRYNIYDENKYYTYLYVLLVKRFIFIRKWFYCNTLRYANTLALNNEDGVMYSWGASGSLAHTARGVLLLFHRFHLEERGVSPKTLFHIHEYKNSCCEFQKSLK